MKELIEWLIVTSGGILIICILLLIILGSMNFLFFLVKKINKIDFEWLIYLASHANIRRGTYTKDMALDKLINWSRCSFNSTKDEERRIAMIKRLVRRLEKADKDLKR